MSLSRASAAMCRLLLEWTASLRRAGTCCTSLVSLIRKPGECESDSFRESDGMRKSLTTADIPPKQSYDLNGRTQRKGPSRPQAPQHPLVYRQRQCQPASCLEIPDSVVQPIPGQSLDERIVTAKPDISLALQEGREQTPYR